MDEKKITLVEDNLILFRGQQVLLDTDVATVYGVETREVNQAVKNNPRKFPKGYIIKPNTEEWSNLKSKILISRWGGKTKLPIFFTELCKTFT